MPGKVFISCGQRPPDEKRIAEAVGELLKKEFGLSPYLAFRVQSLDDIMTITKELRSSDYFLFIDFLRQPEGRQDLPCSLFTHQELALAHHLGFHGIVALQQRCAPLEGFLRYVLCEPERFDDEEDLLEKVRRLVRERGWSPDYSRNLVVDTPVRSPVFRYQDHTGEFIERAWRVRVENRRPDEAAIGAVCILDHIQTVNGAPVEPVDRSYLKWVGQQRGYEQTILPKDHGCIDIFAIHGDKPGLFLHSLRDVIPRRPILTDNGDYDLFFKLFSQGFPLVEFSVRIELRWAPSRPGEWRDKSTAHLAA